MTGTSSLAADLGLSVEDPLVLDNPDEIIWDETADLVIVGLGGAGIAAALEGLERGLSVVAVDRYEGGGSTAANGGVFYAGGGTVIQQAEGEDDDPEEMLKYLRMEAGEVVSDATLRRFVTESVSTVDWIIAHGGKLAGNVWKEKSSYPPLDRFLYHPDNSLVARYRAQAKPAARGHRAFGRDGKKAWGLGKFITAPLTASALRLGLRFHRFSEARQLVQDKSGRVIGVKILSIPEGSTDAARFARYIARANSFLAALPPSIPLASLTIGIGSYYLRKAMAIEARGRTTHMIRAREGVLLSAGGFIMNPRMVARYAPTYAKGMPNGTLGDQGAGIVLGMTAGGSTALMDKISAWRFINPPKAWSDAIVINRAGKRFVDETVYGATLGEHIGDHQGGIAWLIYDKALRRQAFKQARDPKLVPFQRDVTLLNLAFNARKAKTLEALAAKIGIDPAGLAATVADYNRAAAGLAPDPFGKEGSDIQPIATSPFYAMDISIESRFLPLPVITFGGLRVDEESGLVLDAAGKPIPALYAAGRTAVGIASQTYVSGLSFADCFFSGRRAARHAARANQ
ncbi:FAD-binding protein [Sphingomonas paeninsulae]|uniref:FAD-binding protein n=1 Tax=Sphingomonas paeninsulae TaxID=2319844 RepID=A0A494TNI8_SPHPE|nr:FAD-binding protein [Sphingomonas paeninsulae]AYJ87038.1 FAD-binding protein [Sphingomonas paeninsulae]